MISRKVIAQSFVSFVLGVAGWLATKTGWHLSPDVAAELSGLVAWLGGAFAGWLARDYPQWVTGGTVSHGQGEQVAHGRHGPVTRPEPGEEA